MIAGGQTQQIRLSLRDIAENQAVEILYACESGSRAWGFESTDSDWDIRFIYRRPIEAYLRLFPERDTIERMDDPLDFAGWDLLKTLRLAAKSNPALLEWLRSPIVYAETPIVARLRDLMEAFDPSAVMHHYVNVAERQVKAYWHPGKPVRFKKYFYAIRPLMCVTWMTSHGHAMPPVSFHELRAQVELPEPAAGELEALLQMKATSTEIGGAGRFAALDRLIDDGLKQGRELAEGAPRHQPSIDALQALFISEVHASRS